jgi:hypothetical protein
MTATLHRPQFASQSLGVPASATREIVFIDSAVTVIKIWLQECDRVLR